MHFGQESVTFSNGNGTLTHNLNISGSYVVFATLNDQNLTQAYCGFANTTANSCRVTFGLGSSWLAGTTTVAYLIIEL